MVEHTGFESQPFGWLLFLSLCDSMGAVRAGVAGSLAASRKADVDGMYEARFPSDGCSDTANG